MAYEEFPKWKYHDSQEACIVEDADAEDALGEGWRDTPAAESQEAPAPRRGRPRKS